MKTKICGYKLDRLLKCRRGTAEIVGSVLFLVILFFFFTNVYLWHDQATRDMNNVVLDRVNSAVELEIEQLPLSGSYVLQVTNKGGVGFSLSRLWVIKSDDHNYADLMGGQIWLDGGESVNITLIDGSPQFESDGSYKVDFNSDPFGVYSDPSSGDIVRVLTDLGNTAGKAIPELSAG
jgi:hypothetical protein